MQSYKKIVAPLVKIEKKLQDYVASQQQAIKGLETQKNQIESQIWKSHLEIKRSTVAAGKISEMLSADAVRRWC